MMRKRSCLECALLPSTADSSNAHFSQETLPEAHDQPGIDVRSHWRAPSDIHILRMYHVVFNEM